jgi:hypothetical protein
MRNIQFIQLTMMQNYLTCSIQNDRRIVNLSRRGALDEPCTQVGFMLPCPYGLKTTSTREIHPGHPRMSW